MTTGSKLYAAACAALLAASAPVTGSAETDTASEIVHAADPEGLVRVIQDLGYRARLDTDGVGDPLILSSTAGVDFGIYFFGCTNGANCSTLLFKVGFDLRDGTTLETIEAWNERALYGRAYLDDEDDPWLELTANLHGGVTRLNFEDTFDWWETIIGSFRQHIGF